MAQFKHTVLLMPNGVNLVTGIPFNVDSYVSEHSIAQHELKVSINCNQVKVDCMLTIMILCFFRNW